MNSLKFEYLEFKRNYRKSYQKKLAAFVFTWVTEKTK